MKAMNPFTPILPPGSPLARVLAKRRSRVRIMVFVIVTVAVFFLTALLIQGCIHAHSGATGVGIAATNALASVVTANVPVVARSTATVSNVPSHALLVAAPVVTRKPDPLQTTPATVKNYSVAKGDTYSKIAKANDVSVNALGKANPDVKSAKLRIGQVLHIPVAGQKQALPPSNATHASSMTSSKP